MLIIQAVFSYLPGGGRMNEKRSNQNAVFYGGKRVELMILSILFLKGRKVN